MQDNEILKDVTDNLIDTPDILTIPVKPGNRLEELLIKYRLRPSKRKYKIYRLRVGNAYRVSKAVLDIPADIVTMNERATQDMHSLILNHIDKIVYVVAVALQNNRQEPSKAFLERIRWEFSTEELRAILVYVIQKLDLTNFTESIVLARGANIISNPNETSLENREIIARSASLEAL